MSSGSDTQRSQGGCRKGRGGKGRGERGGQGNRSGHVSQKTTVTTGKFKGNCAELLGHIFDCSDYKQANKYVTNMKRIAEYISAEYKQGGNIHSTIKNETATTILIPAEPQPIDPAAVLTTAQELIFKGEIDQYIKRRAMLQENMQKAYLLILGQCTELLKAKLKQLNQWGRVSAAFDVLGLIQLIKSIVFKFDDQKFLPVSLHQVKQNFYSLHQGNASNAEYLEKFNNLVDIASSYDGEIHDTAILEYTRSKMHPGTNPGDQTDAEMALVNEAAKELCLATAFVLQCNKRRYGKLLKELENDFTKGHNNYPPDMVKAYQLLNEYKHWKPAMTAPQSEGMAFAQKGKQNDNQEWAADKVCYECGEKGHIKPNCPSLKKKGDDDNEEDNKDVNDKEAKKKAAAAKKKKEKEKKKKAFMQCMATEYDEDEDNDKNDLSFCTLTNLNKVKTKLLNMILLDNQSTVNLFCN